MKMVGERNGCYILCDEKCGYGKVWVRKGMENRAADEKEDCKASCGRRGLECISLCVCMCVHYMLATHLRVKSSVL